ncbi:hypothetical protein [Gloeocapsopsis dulcis]|uniref:Uncharacterized protein n=1 Tax=Gloeocapsopsis dulcis AAB1 = 1H9 TaxID=1433147 RepID=A0A6N8FVG5_9CHRO|nr:hypothetical protein [Gloeocapsopsis dulcis]MUL36157.1 hypothetical protein [Gloeocapsopsis dulcis AAB1 = 1H9]WNN91368.1 hypothetical protein P0S91_09970 [Gloeocapsopsis dulcis]
MVQEFNPAQNGSKYTPPPAQLDLLAALLSSENATYPWNPADPEAVIYFEEQDQLAIELLSEEEIKARSQHLYSKLEQVWDKATPNWNNSFDNVSCRRDWQNHFITFVPQSWLEAIAHQAQQVFPTESSLAEKLVECVCGLLPSLVEEDLLVLACPFAATTRNAKQESENVISHLQHRKWDELSEIEQAKASLAIARYTLAQMKLANSPYTNGQQH